MKESDLVLPYSNPNLHVIFKGYRPPVTGEKTENGQYKGKFRKDPVNLTSAIMLTLAEKLKEADSSFRLVSLSLNHNSTPKEKMLVILKNTTT